jgi:hypothetical protein
VVKPWVYIYIGNYPRQGISANVFLGRKYEKGEEKKEENVKEKGEKIKDKGKFELKRVK